MCARSELRAKRPTWTAAAADVPTTIAWVDVNGTWKAVVRIEITGTPDQRRITKFGTDGQMLETTIQALTATASAGTTLRAPKQVVKDRDCH